jgi:fatty acid desaturase
MAEAIARIPRRMFRPVAAIYWSDLVLSSCLGWGAFVLSTRAHGLAWAALFVVAGLLLYRATLFIHELVHLATGDVPGFSAGWNLLVGIPFLLPSFLYQGVHLDHHRPTRYGTVADPEYLPFAHRSAWAAVAYVLASLLLPIVLIGRFGLLAPASWICPPLRRFVRDRCSALVINHKYVRQLPIGQAGLVQEVACATFLWTMALLWWTGRVPTRLIVLWAAFIGVASAVNAIRTLAAHRYRHGEDELTVAQQLEDSCTLAPDDPSPRLTLADVWSTACAPVGLRFHALHHWIPSLPYHNLGAAHRLLAKGLPADAPYRLTIAPTITRAIAALVAETRARHEGA